MKNDRLMNKSMKPINPNEMTFHEGLKNWLNKRMATKRSYVPKIKMISLPEMAFDEDMAVAKIIVETSIKDHGRLKGVKEVINEKTGIILGKKGASKLSETGKEFERKFKSSEPKASNMGIKCAGIDIDYNRWKSPTKEETAMWTSGYTPVDATELLDSLELDDSEISLKPHDELDKAARRLKVKIQNDGYVNFERDEGDDGKTLPRLKLKFDDLAYYLENRFKHNQMMAGLPSDMQKVLKRIEKLESEGRGLRYNLKGEYEIIVKNLSTSCYTVQLTSSIREYCVIT